MKQTCPCRYSRRALLRFLPPFSMQNLYTIFLASAILCLSPVAYPDSPPPAKQTYTWTKVTDHAAWSARHNHMSVVSPSGIWLMGGGDNNGGCNRNDVWFSNDGINWNCETENAAWSRRGGGATTIFQDKLWILGGFIFPYGPISNDIWSSEDGIIWNQETESAAWPAQSYKIAIPFQDRLWLLDGNMDGYYASVWCSLNGKEWQLALEHVPWSTREGMTAVVFQDTMWVLGGGIFNMEYGPIALNDMWCTKNGVDWIQVTPNAPWAARSGHTTVVYNSKLWVIGGGYYEGYPRGHVVFLNDVWVSSDGLNWIQENPIPWAPRSGYVSIVFNNKLWILGGCSEDGTMLNDVWYMTGGTVEGEGINEGSSEGESEGQGCSDACHTADQNHDGRISLSELLRIIQFYFTGPYHCDPSGEDGYAPGPAPEKGVPLVVHALDQSLGGSITDATKPDLSRRSPAKTDTVPDKGLLPLVRTWEGEALLSRQIDQPLVAKPDGDTACTPHNADYNPQDWTITLPELLRLIQFYNSGAYHSCPGSEDGFCPGPA